MRVGVDRDFLVLQVYLLLSLCPARYVEEDESVVFRC
jgi:hypothetical protein